MIHRMLIVFPLGLLGTSFLFDVAWLAWGRAELAVASRWLILAGVVAVLPAALFGLTDFLRIPRATRARRLGALHGGGNLIVAALFAVSWFVRGPAPAHPTATALALSAAGVILTLITGWLGGQLVEDEGGQAVGPAPPMHDRGSR
jgi:uncharacterized membrane protein